MPTLAEDFPRILPNLNLNTTGLEDQATWLARRNFVDQIRPNHTQRITLIVAASYILAIGILWCVVLVALWPPKARLNVPVCIGMCRILTSYVSVLLCIYEVHD